MIHKQLIVKSRWVWSIACRVSCDFLWSRLTADTAHYSTMPEGTAVIGMKEDSKGNFSIVDKTRMGFHCSDLFAARAFLEWLCFVFATC